jgi:hypothetical protein
MWKRIRARLVDDLNQAHKWLSVQAAALLALIAAGYDYLPDAQRYLSPGWVKWGALVVLLARLIKQPQAHAESEKQNETS